MVRRFLSPLLAFALVVPGVPIRSAAEEEKKNPPAPEWQTYLDVPGSAAIKLDKLGFLRGKTDDTAEAGWVGKSFDELDKYLSGMEAKIDAGDDAQRAEFQKVRLAFQNELAKIISEHYRKHDVSDENLKKLLDDPKKLAELLGKDNKWTSRILLDALAAKDPGKLARLQDELKEWAKTGGTGKPEDFIKYLEAALSDPKHKDHERARKMMQRIDGGEVSAPERDRDDGSVTNPNERRLKRSEESLASIGFSGRQAYGEFGDRHVYRDAKGNTVSLSLATISRPDGSKEDLITIVNLNDPSNPHGTSYSLRTDAGRLQTGINMTLGGVPVQIKVGEGGAISLSGPGGEMKNGGEPAAGPMGLSQLYAYRAARVYQYGKVVTIGGKQYYAAPETYGMLQGEGEAIQLQGFGQITYWPVEDLRKVFGEEDPPGSGNWVDKIDPQTFDYKSLDLAGTQFAAGFNTMRPQLGATVIKREGLQDVQILRASAGQDAEGRWWDAVFKNGEYVLEPGQAPQDPNAPQQPGLPADEQQRVLANLNQSVQERMPGSKLTFVTLTDGTIGLFQDGNGFSLKSVSDPRQIKFLEGGVLSYPAGEGSFGVLNLEDQPRTGPAQDTSMVLHQKGEEGFEITSGGATASLFKKLAAGDFKTLHANFELTDGGGLVKVIEGLQKDFPGFVAFKGKTGAFTVLLEDSSADETAQFAHYELGYDGAWTAKRTVAGDGTKTAGAPFSLAFGSNGVGAPVDGSNFTTGSGAANDDKRTAVLTVGRAGVYAPKDKVKDGAFPLNEAVYKFAVIETAVPKDRKQTKPQGYLFEPRLDWLLRNHPLVKTDGSIKAADLAGIKFNQNIAMPATMDFLKQNSGLERMEFDFSEAPKGGTSGIVYLKLDGKRVEGAWVAAWGDKVPSGS